ADLGGQLIIVLMFGGQPHLAGLLEDLLAQRVYAAVQGRDGAAAHRPSPRLFAQLGEQRVEGLHGWRLFHGGRDAVTRVHLITGRRGQAVRSSTSLFSSAWIERRALTSILASDPTCRRRGPCGTSTSLGTTKTGQPALSADAVPVTESSIAKQHSGNSPSCSTARKYGSGAGLPRATSSPQ